MKLTQITPSGSPGSSFVSFRSGKSRQAVLGLSAALVGAVGVKAGGRAAIFTGDDCIVLDLAPEKSNPYTYALIKDGSAGLAVYTTRSLLPKIEPQRWLNPPVRGKRITLKVPKAAIAALRKKAGGGSAA